MGMKRAIHVYVAGPLTEGNWPANVALALDVGERLRKGGLVPFVPHMTATSWALRHPTVPHSEWMAWCLAWVERCDVLLRIEGVSQGSQREVWRALSLTVPVYRHSEGEPGSNGVWKLISDVEAGCLGRQRDHREEYQ